MTTAKKTPRKIVVPRKPAAVKAAPASSERPELSSEIVTQAAPDMDAAGTSVSLDQPQALPAELKKRELIEQVVLRSGQKKRNVKPAIEAALEILGQSLSEGRELNLPPFGKMKVEDARNTPNGKVLVARLRRSKETGPKAPDPLAQAAE